MCFLENQTLSFTLKGTVSRIWQLYKNLEGVFALIEFQN